jgi:hypothetical protein
VSDLKALCAEYERAPSTELRSRLLEELLSAYMRTSTIGHNALGRRFLASEQRRVEKAFGDMECIGFALTNTKPTRLADARARLAAVG